MPSKERLADILLEQLLEICRSHGVMCSMSGSIYCTAWVSMVSKPIDGNLVWLFPSSFQYICDHQQEDGGWEGEVVVDQIVNTLACLLSMTEHQKTEGDSSLKNKIARATAFLNERFLEWDILNTERIAFEIIVPSLLNLLEQNSIEFHFPGLDMLRRLKVEKMSKLNLDLLYQCPSTMLHSLEAFIGIINFDKIKHHLSKGSMMCSPSSTAAYLMNVSEWDTEAERYLIDAIGNGRRHGEGMVSEVYPITIFEFAWVPSS